MLNSSRHHIKMVFCIFRRSWKRYISTMGTCTNTNTHICKKFEAVWQQIQASKNKCRHTFTKIMMLIMISECSPSHWSGVRHFAPPPQTPASVTRTPDTGTRIGRDGTESKWTAFNHTTYRQIDVLWPLLSWVHPGTVSAGKSTHSAHLQHVLPACLLPVYLSSACLPVLLSTCLLPDICLTSPCLHCLCDCPMSVQVSSACLSLPDFTSVHPSTASCLPADIY